MLGLILDACVLVGLVMFLNEDRESPGFGKAIAAAFAIGLLTFVALLGMGEALGIWALVIILPAAAGIAGLVLWIVFDVQPLKALLGGGVYLVYKVALVFVMMSLIPA